MATPGARRRELGGLLLSRHQGDAEVDGEVEKEDILEEEAKVEKKKVTKGAQVCRTFCTANFMFNSGPEWPAVVPSLCRHKRQYDSIFSRNHYFHSFLLKHDKFFNNPKKFQMV